MILAGMLSGKLKNNASYCSSLTKMQIIEIYQSFLEKERRDEDAKSNFLDFFEKEDLDEINFNIPQSQKYLYFI